MTKKNTQKATFDVIKGKGGSATGHFRPKREQKIKIMEGTTPTIPQGSKVVHGGPVIKGVRCIFGFSVFEDTNGDDGVMGTRKKFGVGKGVSLHCTKDTPEGKLNTYKIVY